VVTGRIKVKVGPVSLTYRGTAKFTERDPEAHIVVVEASGKEMRGAGTASATVRASLEPEASGDSTRVAMHTTMNVTGRPAQFGRGVIVEVGGKLVDQFAQNLARQITGDTAGNGTATAAEGAQAEGVHAEGEAGAGQAAAVADAAQGTPVPVSAVSSAPPAADRGEDSLNLVRLVGPAILKRVVPVAAAVAAAVFLGQRLRRVFRRRAD
jgi:carbon monoxide dehydrogenase subunit G